MYLFSGSAAGPLLTLSTTHRGAEAPRIHDANVRSTAHDDDGSQTAEARKRGAHVLTRGGARPTGPGRWGERHGGHKRREAVVPLVIARSLAPSRASRAPPAPPRATRHSRNLCASVPRCRNRLWETIFTATSDPHHRVNDAIRRPRATDHANQLNAFGVSASQWLVFVSFVASAFVVISRTR